ncbi:DUF1629 domain-containing protein [Lysobacter capsici]|uniref:imm11 family protein n=1 Tax=Lysobacter capsici TaxID=435897 RepID=UPI0017857FF1|nr:DUF1629 domain-containing protein [Lysobacter capsici]UOF13255.1 DUF1629 domain-containing protein [Lysobacter capsici]
MDSQATVETIYVLRPSFSGRGPGHGLVFANLESLLAPPRRILRPTAGGFPPLRETPLLIQEQSGKATLDDLEASFSGYWLVSDRLKNAFEDNDPQGFAFARCDVKMADGSDAGERYLCDVLRVIDALDEERSETRIDVGDDFVNGKFYHVTTGSSLIFRREVIGSAHTFRTPYSGFVFCDESMRAALVSGGFSGVETEDASDY